MLRGSARSLSAVLRATDLLARIGGDEFAVLLPETNLTGAENVAIDARDQIATGRRDDPRFDMPQPPSSPNGGSRIAFVRPEWELAAGNYFTRDIMPEGKDPLTWNAVIQASSPGKVVLSWNGTDWPEGVDYQIYLPEENRVVVMSMRSQNNVHLEVGSRAVPIVFRTPDMTTGVEDMPGMNYEVGVHPNPFNPMTTIHFDLPRAANAEIRIYSVRGELFSVLGGQQYPAGRQEVIWQGRDRHGRNAPSGSYFARLYVDGSPMGTVTKMSLVR